MPTEVKSQIVPAMCGRTETGGSKNYLQVRDK